MRILTAMAVSFTAFALLSAGCDNSIEKWSGKDNPAKGHEQQPVAEGSRWASIADTCTRVLIDNFMDRNTGTFWSTPNDMEHSSEYIYWQQAHALDVMLYSYQRIKDSDNVLAGKYLDYIERWYSNHANNYNKSHISDGDGGGFYNDYTDDMCWICLTLLHMTDITGVEKYAVTAKAVFDKYVWPRATTGSKGMSLPWTSYDKDKDNRNACTNCPACLVAVLLYQKFEDGDYLSTAKTLWSFDIANMPDAERVEEPPLSYTQGTLAEAGRQLYHVTGDKSYMDKAGQVLLYCLNSNRTSTDGILRHEGTSMDQSLFKAVFVPYAVNYVLDADADGAKATSVKEKLLFCATALDAHLDRNRYPQMYCDYYWGTTFTSGTPSMGAQASGASLMEGVARMMANNKQ